MGSLTNGLVSLIQLACVAVAVWALIDCATRPTAAFVAAGKLSKPAWLAITAGGLMVLLLFNLFGGGALFSLAGIIAVIVYLVDVRPAVRAVQGGGGGGGGGRW